MRVYLFNSKQIDEWMTGRVDEKNELIYRWREEYVKEVMPWLASDRVTETTLGAFLFV